MEKNAGMFSSKTLISLRLNILDDMGGTNPLIEFYFIFSLKEEFQIFSVI